MDIFGANLLGMWMGTHVNGWLERFSSERVREEEDALSKKDDDRGQKGELFELTASAVGSKLDWSGEQDLDAVEEIIKNINPVNLAFLPQYKWRIFSR